LPADRQRDAITVLGLGPMGRAIAGAYLAGGHPTTVWNRSPGKADELVERGAAIAPTVSDAVAASRVTIVSVLNYDVADELLQSAAGALVGKTVVNLTSDTPARARRTATWATGRRAGYLDGSILTPSYTMGTDAAAVLVAGPAPLFEDERSTLARLGGSATYVGEDYGRAAAYDVALLDTFWTTISGITHGFALGRAEGIAPTELLPLSLGLVDILPAIITDIAERSSAGNHADGTSSILSARTAMAHIARASRDRGLDDGVLRAAGALAELAISDGHGADEISRLVEAAAQG
jgi:3-hydroxyisobutyrate dehydrogenase-like beta-hydroxyacid dehydrogenase